MERGERPLIQFPARLDCATPPTQTLVPRIVHLEALIKILAATASPFIPIFPLYGPPPRSRRYFDYREESVWRRNFYGG